MATRHHYRLACNPACAQVHEGIMAAATYVHSNTAPALERAAAEHPGWPLLLTGHSLGGMHILERSTVLTTSSTSPWRSHALNC